MCLKVGADRWDILLFTSPPRRALFCCRCAAWREEAIGVSARKKEQRTVGAQLCSEVESADDNLPCRTPVGSDGSGPPLVVLLMESSVWTQRGWMSAAHSFRSAQPCTHSWTFQASFLFAESSSRGLQSLIWKRRARREAGLFMLDLIESS